jgi:3-oxochol-4-en-24-oyl-CoA dehydrogenase
VAGNQVAGDATAQQLLGPIIAGDSLATLAWSGAAPHLSTLALTGQTISGSAAYVLDAAIADLILVAARDATGAIALLAVAPDAAGLTRTRLTTMDSTRGLARLDFDEVSGTVLAADAGAGLERTFHIARLLLAAEALGGAQRAFESALAYSLERVQFGRRIGSFQVIKHRCADLLMEVELARSVVYHGLSAAAADDRALPVESALAASFCSDAYLTVAAANIQIHGGIGFTWEHSAHLYLKRAKSTSLLFGTATAQRRQLAQSLGVIR